MTSNERLVKVEEAVIEFRSIAKTIVVDHKFRLDKLESNERVMSDAMNTSCTIKDKQINDGDSNTLTKSISYTSIIVIILFGLFVGAVVHFNGAIAEAKASNNKEHADMRTSSSVYHEDTVRIETLTEVVIKSLDSFEHKLDVLAMHKHDDKNIIDRLNKMENYQNRNYGLIQGLGKKVSK